MPHGADKLREVLLQNFRITPELLFMLTAVARHAPEIFLPTAPPGKAGSRERLARSLLDRYRCPESFLEWDLGDTLSSDEGFFRFGPDVTCYGSSARGTRKSKPDAALYDVSADVFLGENLELPFNPSEVIENLRLERYTRGTTAFQRFLKKTYYHLRPLMSQGMRSAVQRFRARRWRELQFPKWPVDTTVEDICERLLLLSMEAKGVDEVPFVWFWPEGAQGCVCMTHDVESKAGRDFCSTLMDVDDSFGIKSSFQLIPEGSYEVSQEFVDGIRKRGCDVAIHCLSHDGRMFDEREEFLRRAARIDQYARDYGARGFRSAVLYRNPEWFDALNVSFDMSIPNVAHLDPQRGGCCTVMPYFIGDILEIPVTTTQDYMLFHLLQDRSIDLWKTQLGMIMEKHGMASFIVHPDYVMTPELLAVYRDLLRHLQGLRSRRNTWFALPGEIDSWWRSRSRMRVARSYGSWRIVGEDTDRAVLAFARNVNGKLVYDLPKR